MMFRKAAVGISCAAGGLGAGMQILKRMKWSAHAKTDPKKDPEMAAIQEMGAPKLASLFESEDGIELLDAMEVLHYHTGKSKRNEKARGDA